MYIQNILKKLTIYLLIASLSIPLFLCAPLSAKAATSDLYGTGSADEINIVKLLDMALNRSGMSMSPATIRAFLEFWWSSVQEDLNSCISNVDTSIMGTQAFISALGDIIDAPEYVDKLGGILKKYLSFVATMEYETLSDFKSLLTQQDTFRKFLLSYVVDEEGNIAGTVNNKLKKYRLKSEFVNLTRKAADAYIEEYEGYYLVSTRKPSEISPTEFNDKRVYDSVMESLSGLTDSSIIFSSTIYNSNKGSYYYSFFDCQNFDFYINDHRTNIPYLCNNVLLDAGTICVANQNWTLANVPYLSFGYPYNSQTKESEPDGTGFTAADIKLSENCRALSFYFLNAKPYDTYSSYLLGWLYTKDGHSVKVWKSLDALKKYTAGKSDIYYTKDYSGYDMTADNTVGFTGSYYSSNSSSYSHDVIQNTIDNSSEVNESTINNIVNNYITNNYGDGSGSGGSGGSGDSGNGWWHIGDGISAVIEGIASLLDFLLKLIGDLVGLLGTFLSSLLDVLSSLASVGQGFGDFITESFKFIPKECVDLIFASIAGMCVAGVIRAFVK